MPIQQVIKEGLLSPYFQPIVAVNEGRVIGYEALIRGPAHLNLREPAELFAAAERAGLLRELERNCWTTILDQAARNFARIPRWSRVFLNVLPEDICDPAFLAHVVSELARIKLDPERIVIEITESSRVDDYPAFNSSLRTFREMGFGVAVDDAGAGHSGLQMIAEINPDFLKIDQGLVRGIDQSIAKRAGVEALLLLARSLGMTVIAEGIESEDELHELHRLGVALGQGFLLARPSREMDAGIKSLPYQLKPSPWCEVDLEFHGGSGRIGDIASPAPTLTRDVQLNRVLQLFEDRRADDVAVVVEDGIPVGLLMRDKLTQERARHFGVDTFATRTVAHLMSEQPLIVDCEAHLDAVARMATARGDEDRYDDITVVRDRKLVGTVSVRCLLDAVTDARLASANHANPLSGLPGHPVIEEWVRVRLRNRENAALVHIDIDELREFNEAYGFHQGDRAIRMAADLVASELAARSGGHSQLGHVGGDNFLAVVDADCAGELQLSLPQMFRERVSVLYHPEDRARGYHIRQSAHSEAVRVPLMSLTIAHIQVSSGSRQHYAELLDILSDAMLLARTKSRGVREAVLCVPPPTQLERRASTVVS